MWGFSRIKLKRGRRWPTYPLTNVQNTFATFRKPDGRAAWLSPTTYDGVPVDVYTGVLERIDGNGISVVTGAGFGGGSLVYNGITYQPPRELFTESSQVRLTTTSWIKLLPSRPSNTSSLTDSLRYFGY
jgi:cholesterol oxidase